MTAPLPNGQIYYLASPYAHPSPSIREQRYRDLQEYAGPLMVAGYFIYAPILQTHPVAARFSLPVEFEWWEQYNRAFIRISAGVIVADISGWSESRGVRHEIALARKMLLPVWLLDIHGRFSQL